MATATTSRTKTAGLELVPLRGRVSFAPLSLRPGRHMLGADAGCDLCLALEGVAAQHCLIIAGPQKTLVKALSPLTWINDGPCGESVLKAGDRLVIGPVELLARATVLVDEAPVASAPAVVDEPRQRVEPVVVPPPLPPAVRTPVTPATRLADVTTPRSLFQSDPAWQSASTEAASVSPTPPPLPMSPPPLPRSVDVTVEQERRLADQERKLAEADQERRLLARKLDEAQARQDREGKLTADLERERILVRTLRTELNDARTAASRPSVDSDEVLSLRGQVESLTQKLASVRPATPEADRSGLLQQRMELLAMRRDVQEKLTEQHRLENEIEEARQALLRDADDFRKQQETAQEEFSRIEHLMAEFEQHRSGLAEREETLQREFDRIAGLESDVARRSGEVDEHRQGLVSRQAELDSEHRRLQALRAEAAEVSRAQEELAAREAELDRIAEQLEQELQHAERTAEQHRVSSLEVEALRKELGQRDETLRSSERELATRHADLEHSSIQLEQARAEAEQRLRDHAARDEEHKSVRALLDERAAAHEEAARRLEERMTELAGREHHIQTRESAIDERHRLLSLAETAPAAAPVGQDEIDSLNEAREELQRHAEDLRQQAAELADARSFIASRERAIEARLLELKEREAVIASRPVSSGADSDGTAEEAPQSIDRDLEEARLSAESLAQRERDISEKFELIQERESALDDLESTLRRRELALDEREEQAGWSTPGITAPPAPVSPSTPAPDVEAITRELEAAYAEQVAALDAERAEVEQLRGELKEHRSAFLQQYEALERDRNDFETERHELDQERLHVAQERATLEAEREALEYERNSAAAPFLPESHETGHFGAAAYAHPHPPEPQDEPAVTPPPIPSPFPFAARPSLSTRPSLDESELESPAPHASPFAPRPSQPLPPERPALGEPELLGAAGRFFPDEIGRRFLPAAELPPEDQAEFDEEQDPHGALATTLIEEELPTESAEPAPPGEGPSSDALELRAHLADLFGIDLSHRRSSMLSAAEPAEAPALDAESEQYAEEDYASEPVAELPPPIESPPPVDEPPIDEDDVASYMERLLKRTRTGIMDFQRSVAPAPAPAPPPPVPAPKPDEVAPSLAEEAARPVRRPLAQQEKDAIRGSMDSFRELANRTARAAVARHQLVKLRQTHSTKGMLAGFCTVVTVILVVPEIWGSDRYRIAAIAAAVVTFIASMEWLRTKIRIKKLDDFVAESDISKDPPLEDEEPVQE